MILVLEKLVFLIKIKFKGFVSLLPILYMISEVLILYDIIELTYFKVISYHTK